MPRSIVSTADTCGGSPRIDGTRLTCANVVLSLTIGEMSPVEYLTFHQDLVIADIKACATYCAKQRCIDNHVITFCHGCALDSRTSESCEIPNAVDVDLDLEFDESSEDEKLNVWELADELISELSEQEG
jgi:uncharacterized protein (DUF433 family)